MIRTEGTVENKPNTSSGFRGTEERDGISRATAEEAGIAAALACELWHEHTPEEMAEEYARLLSAGDAAVFLCRKNGKPVGFAQCQLRRDYVEGTETSPVGYLEGVYVREENRKQGIARELLSACVRWAKGLGCSEFASDCELTNTESQAFHQAVGFTEANRIVAYVRKI
jgi:aminoglycoside 6'-N-acetyltransferase I